MVRDKRTLSALVASFVLLLLAGVAAIILAINSRSANLWVAHTIEVRLQNRTVLSTMEEAVLAERGFLITGDERFAQGLAQYRDALPRLEQRLRLLCQDNPDELHRLDRLESLFRDQLGQVDQMMALARQGRPDKASAFMRERLDANPMVSIRAISDTIDQQEFSLLRRRQDEAELQGLLLQWTILVSLLGSGLLALYVTRSTRHSIARLQERNEALAAEMNRREAAEAQLRQAQKMEALGQLTGGVAHDFNNMLSVVIGNLDLLLKQIGDQQFSGRRHVVNAIDGAQRAAMLVKRLLAFARRQPLAPRPLDVNRCVSDMSQMLQRTLGPDIAIETVLFSGLWMAEIDQPQLESAILNLALNARDAMPDGGSLTVETANIVLDDAYAALNAEVAAGRYVLVSVTDDGSGMPVDVAARAFEPFFTTKRDGRGTGLGLSQVHGFIKQSGGHVKICSELGVGTTVKLYLPRYAGELGAETAAAAPARADHARGVTVLVVEDEAAVRAFAADGLAELGCRVVQAENAAHALRLLDEGPEITLLVTDLAMPDLNGRQLAERAKRIRPTLKVLFMTGYPRNAAAKRGGNETDAPLLVKPFRLAELSAMLDAVLAPGE